MKYKEYWISLNGFNLIVAEDEDIDDAIDEYIIKNEIGDVDIDDVQLEKQLTKEEVKKDGIINCSKKVQEDIWGKEIAER